MKPFIIKYQAIQAFDTERNARGLTLIDTTESESVLLKKMQLSVLP